MCREFAKEKERVESRAGFMALKEQQKLEKELTGYVEWICRAGEPVLPIPFFCPNTSLHPDIYCMQL
jgi:hypothetical protein